jgi:hypothetical protein
MMSSEQSVQAVFGLTGFRTYSTGFPTLREHFIRLELPPRFDREHIMQAQKDYEILAKRAAQYPQELVELHNAVLAHDLPRANQLAREIGITPRQLHDEGGGAAESALVVVIVVFLLGYAILSDSPPPPAPPPRPVGPDGGVPPGDAGTNG